MDTFAGRFTYFLHSLRVISRNNFAMQLKQRKSRSSRAQAELSQVTPQTVHDWESGRSEPCSEVREVIARLLGVHISLLDPSAPDSRVFLELVQRLGLKTVQINHLWKVFGGSVSFKGEPRLRDLETLIRNDPTLVLEGVQMDFFQDEEFRCKWCGHWEDNFAATCFVCGKS